MPTIDVRFCLDSPPYPGESTNFMDGPLQDGSASDTFFFINSIIFMCKELKMNSYLIELEEDLNFS